MRTRMKYICTWWFVPYVVSYTNQARTPYRYVLIYLHMYRPVLSCRLQTDFLGVQKYVVRKISGQVEIHQP